MANSSLVYSIKINGLDVATENVENLTSSVENLGEAFVQVGNDVDLKPVNTEIDNLNENLDDLNNNLNNLDGKDIDLPTDSIENLGKKSAITAEKVDKLSTAGEKGFKGISDALKLFGVDTTILDNVKESLGALGDLLDSQSKLSDIAFDSSSIEKQGEAIESVTTLQKANTTATIAGAAATEAGAASTTKLTIAQRALNLVLSVNPYVAIVAGIAAIIAITKVWVANQKNDIKVVEGALQGLNKRINETYDSYGRNIDKVERKFAQNETQGTILLETLNAQLNVLETQGANLDKIAKVRKEILQAEITSLETQIQKNQALVIQTAISLNDYQIELIGAKREEERLKNLKLRNKLDEDGQALLEQVTQTRLAIEDKITSLENANQQRKNENLILENQINLKKTFGLQIINAQTKAQKEQLAQQEKSAKLNLEENQRKLTEEIKNSKKSLEEFRKDYERLIIDLKKGILDQDYELKIKLGDISGVIGKVIEDINDIPNQINIEKGKLEKQLSEPLEKGVAEALKTADLAIQQLGNTLDLVTKASGDKISNFIGKLKTDISDFKSNIEIRIQGGEDIQKVNEDITSFFNKLREQAQVDFNLGKLTPEELEKVNSSINTLDTSFKSFAQTQQQLTQIKVGDTIVGQYIQNEAALKAFAQTFDNTSKVIKDASGVIQKNVDDAGKNINDKLKDLESKIDNSGIGLAFSGLLKKEDRDKLKKDIKDSIDGGLAQLDSQKAALQQAYAELFFADPKAAEQFAPVIDALLKQIDDLKAKLKEQGVDLTGNVDKTFKKGFDKIIDDAAEFAQKFGEIFQGLADLESARIDNQISQLEDYYNNRNQIIESQLEQEQIYADRQSEIVSDSQSRLNDLENQLQNARGSRAAFLQKLRAEEQARLQKAEAEKIASANRQKKLDEEQKKLEAQKAADLEVLERKKFDIQKKSNIANIIINTAVAVTQALKSPPGPPETIPLSILIGALGAVQLATAATAKFAKGGLLEGPSHSNGGIPIMVGGGRLVEAEGGEYIINRKSTAKNIDLIRTINENPNIKFQNGGMLPSSSNLNNSLISSVIKNTQTTPIGDSENINRIITTITDNLSNISVQASIQDIRDVNAINMQIEDLRKI